MRRKGLIKLVSMLLLFCTLPVGMFACGVVDEPVDTSIDAGSDSVSADTNVPDSGASGDTDKNVDEKKEMTLYNGIELPADWPPDDIEAKVGGSSGEIPYLISKAEGGTRPDVIDISVGRQLFVDDFLIESTTLKSTAHKATPYSNSPIIVPDTQTDGNACLLSSSGVWYDEEEKLFKMWYLANWTAGVAYATSKDGINWEKPMVGAGNNIVYKQLQPDSVAVWMDKNAKNPNEKYVMFVRTADTKNKDYVKGNYYYKGYIYTSPDGIKWKFKTQTGICGDRSTIFYNPFMEKWCFSIRSYINHEGKKTHRARNLFMTSSLGNLVNSTKEMVNWIFSDKQDKTNEYFDVAEIYCVDAVAYESIMLSMVEILEGPDNSKSNELGIPKVTELTLGFSRDGFHFDRTNKEPIITASQDATKWDQGYLSPAAGVCVTVGDKLYFYYSGWQASSTKAYDKCRIGLATMRRDGFVSMDGTGELTTRAMCVEDGRKYLFVNAKGSVKAEILDENGNVYAGYSVNDCVGFTGDSTCTKLSWTSGDDLSFLEGKNFKIRFYTENAEFYSFWLSDTADGESHGYHAAGLVE